MTPETPQSERSYPAVGGTGCLHGSGERGDRPATAAARCHAGGRRQVQSLTRHDVTGAGWGLILTGGANWGAVQAGAARALFERGFKPEVIAGVSVGAINGAYLAAVPTVEGVDALVRLWEEADARKILGTRMAVAREVAAFLFHESAAFSNRALRSFLEAALPVARFEDTTVPFTLVASDLVTGTPRLLSSGDLLDAVLASAAIPGLFPSVEVDGELLVDGAISDPLPVPAMSARGIRRVVVVEAGWSCGCGDDLEHPLDLFQRAVSVVMNDRMNLLMTLASRSVELIHLGLVCHPETPITDLSDAALRAKLGYEDAARRLDGEAPKVSCTCTPPASGRSPSPDTEKPASGPPPGVPRTA